MRKCKLKKKMNFQLKSMFKNFKKMSSMELMEAGKIKAHLYHAINFYPKFKYQIMIVNF